MNSTRILPALAFGLALGSAPAAAQSPLFMDGTAFGGSKVFSEGINPLGNSARFDQPDPQPALFATYFDGNQRSKDNHKVLGDMGVGGSAVTITADHLNRLADSPWALRAKGFGLAYVAKTGNTSYTHEDFNSFLATTDRSPTGTTTADVRRSVADRVVMGVGSMEQGMALGFSLRFERWKMGTQTLYLNPTGSQAALSGGPDPFGFTGTSNSTLTWAVDFGFVYELMPGVLVGGTIDRLNQKHLWDVYERPQARIGLQVDIGTMAKLSAEMDVNDAQRMPFPVNQRTTSASLRVAANQSIAFLLGVERRKVGDAAVTRAGASIQVRANSFLVGVGFQIGEEKPLKGAMMMVN